MAPARARGPDVGAHHSALPGDGVSEVVWATWTRDGQILALKQGMNATIWTFTPE